MAFSKGAPFLPRTAATASLVPDAQLGVVWSMLLFSAVSPGSDSERLRLFELGVTGWLVWALEWLGPALDSSKLLCPPGRPVAPLGSPGFSGTLLGVLKLGASLLVVLLQTSRPTSGRSKADDFLARSRLSSGQGRVHPRNRSSSIFACRIDRGSSPETLITSLCVRGQRTQRASYLSSLIESESAGIDE